MAILLKNGLVYQEGEFINEDVLIFGSKIQAIGLDLPEEGAEVYDLKGKLLAPGLVDIHEHYREPGFKPSRRGLKQRPGAVSPRSAPCLMLTRSQMTWKLLKSRLL